MHLHPYYLFSPMFSVSAATAAAERVKAYLLVNALETGSNDIDVRGARSKDEVRLRASTLNILTEGILSSENGTKIHRVESGLFSDSIAELQAYLKQCGEPATPDEKWALFRDNPESMPAWLKQSVGVAKGAEAEQGIVLGDLVHLVYGASWVRASKRKWEREHVPGTTPAEALAAAGSPTHDADGQPLSVNQQIQWLAARAAAFQPMHAALECVRTVVEDGSSIPGEYDRSWVEPPAMQRVHEALQVAEAALDRAPNPAEASPVV